MLKGIHAHLLEMADEIHTRRRFLEGVNTHSVLVFLQDAQNGQFKAVTGKYELIETDESDPTAVAAVMTSGGISSSSLGPLKKTLPCKLDTTTKELVELIFRLDGIILEHLVIDLESLPPTMIRPQNHHVAAFEILLSFLAMRDDVILLVGPIVSEGLVPSSGPS